MLFLGGSNYYFQLGEESSSPNRCVSPPVQSGINVNSIISYSIYLNNAVLIRCDGALQAVGYARDKRISGSLPERELKEYTNFFITDRYSNYYTPISAICGAFYTLYLVSNYNNDGKLKLAYSYETTKTNYATFLNIGDSNPVALFGGYSTAFAIDSDGKILYIPI